MYTDQMVVQTRHCLKNLTTPVTILDMISFDSFMRTNIWKSISQYMHVHRPNGCTNRNCLKILTTPVTILGGCHKEKEYI